MPTVVGIEDSLNVSLQEISTMVYGYANNFCMDLGTLNRITVKYERVNPFPYDDSSRDPNQWSNGKWFSHLESLLDFWQNLGVDYDDGTWTGGFTFAYNSEDTSLYPSFSHNVFMVGSLNRTYKTTQKMTFQLPMVVSTMQNETKKAPRVKLYLRTPISGDGYTSYEDNVYEVLKGYEVSMPPCPPDWEKEYQPGMSFTGWNSSDGDHYGPNDTNTWTADAYLTATWEGPLDVTFKFEPGEYVIDIPNGATAFIAYLIGAGGGAGGGRNNFGSGSPRTYHLKGGAGGAGETVIKPRTNISSHDVIKVSIGKGGTGGLNSTVGTRLPDKGKKGEDTTLNINGTVTRAHGGDGGGIIPSATQTDYLVAPGGVNYVKGGSTRSDGDGESGTNGVKGLPESEWKVGKGGKGAVSGLHYYQGGAGGATADLRLRFNTELSGWCPSADSYYESTGGDGETYSPDGSGVKSEPATSGTFGGSGGSGSLKDSLLAGSGGDGCVVIVWYK